MVKLSVKPYFTDSATNPARSYLGHGLIEINKSVFDRLTPYQRKYVLLHELGHLSNNSKDEVAADRYALDRMALKEPYSLINYVDAVDRIALSKKRKKQARIDVLQIAAENGSREAQELLGMVNAEGSQESATTIPTWIWAALTVLIILIIVYYAKK